MTKREQFEVMKAYYEEGKTIESRLKSDGPDGQWLFHVDEPSWYWDRYDYRVKKDEIEIRPYNEAEEFYNDMKVCGPMLTDYSGNYYTPIFVGENGIAIVKEKQKIVEYNWQQLVDSICWQDGTVCGMIK